MFLCRWNHRYLTQIRTWASSRGKTAFGWSTKYNAKPLQFYLTLYPPLLSVLCFLHATCLFVSLCVCVCVCVTPLHPYLDVLLRLHICKSACVPLLLPGAHMNPALTVCTCLICFVYEWFDMWAGILSCACVCLCGWMRSGLPGFPLLVRDKAVGWLC